LDLVLDEPVAGGASGVPRDLVARLRAVIEAKDAENTALRTGLAGLRGELEAERELRRRLELRVAELERRLGMDSSNSGTPTSRESVEAKERRKAERWKRQASERERRKDRRRGGQPGHRGTGLSRDLDPGERKSADPPAQCSWCGTGLGGAQSAGSSWAQVWDVKISRLVTEWLLPMLGCPCCGQVTTAAAPPGAHAGTVCYGPGVNAAAVLLAAYGNVPADRTAHLIGMLLGMPVSPGFVDNAGTRLDARLADAGFDAAMQAALAAEPALGADETPVSVLAPDTSPETGEPETGSPHVLVIRTPGGKLTWLQALGSRRAEAITAILGFFTGFLTTDGYTAYQQMLPQLAGIQQCAAHVIRRCRAVTKLGPGSLQSWAADVIEILREAHRAVEEARARGDPAAGTELLAKLRERCPSHSHGLPDTSKGECFYLTHTGMTISRFASVTITQPSPGISDYWLSFRLQRADIRRYADLTQKLANLPAPRDQLAIIANGVVLFHPSVVAPLSFGVFEIEAGHTRAQAQQLLHALEHR